MLQRLSISEVSFDNLKFVFEPVFPNGNDSIHGIFFFYKSVSSDTKKYLQSKVLLLHLLIKLFGASNWTNLSKIFRMSLGVLDNFNSV